MTAAELMQEAPADEPITQEQIDWLERITHEENLRIEEELQRAWDYAEYVDDL